MKDGLKARLDALADGLLSMKRDGFPVDAIEPQGAIYLSARFDLAGATCRGRKLETNEQIRKLLLEEAGFAAVPFQAFGLREETGWFRLSVGAVAPARDRRRPAAPPGHARGRGPSLPLNRHGRERAPPSTT